MLGTLLLISFVVTLFLLFLNSFLFFIGKNLVDPEWMSLFEDVQRINPNLSPLEVVLGTLLSYFTVSALIAVLLRVSWDLKKRGDVYAIDDAVKEGLLAGALGLLIGTVLRVLGFFELSNVGVYLAGVAFEIKRSPKTSAVLFLLLVFTGSLIYFLLSGGYIPLSAVNYLYYVGLIVLPPVLVALARSI